MRAVLLLPLLAACTEPTWYPGLPAGVAQDTAGDGGGDGGWGDGGGGDGGGGDGGGAELPCSTDGTTAATLTIDLRIDVSATLYWRDYDCVESSYGAVVPGVLRDQPTYLGHAWVLRDAGGSYLDHVVVDQVAQRWEVSE